MEGGHYIKSFEEQGTDLNKRYRKIRSRNEGQRDDINGGLKRTNLIKINIFYLDIKVSFIILLNTNLFKVKLKTREVGRKGERRYPFIKVIKK